MTGKTVGRRLESVDFDRAYTRCGPTASSDGIGVERSGSGSSDAMTGVERLEAT
ncbi:hypothetical protein ACFQGT_01070 [Natrialbaceae archaeon GCM10025810]|uniref:hypothetical protein n=1 Tax=Halovalidus salilacus TaxID=3075124 RepID=UPI0036122C0A